jgi:hypothetical protein
MAPDLPEPGSPPSSKLRSGRAMWTHWPASSTPTGTGSHSEHRGAPSSGQGSGSLVCRASRRTTVTRARAAWSGSRATRTSRTSRITATCSAASASAPVLDPAGRRTSSRSPAGISAWRTMRGMRSLPVARPE